MSDPTILAIGNMLKTSQNIISVGPQGPEGQQGLQGPAGAQGPIGPQGIQGIQGGTGPTGPQGIQGIQGETGLTGPQGISSYQVWLNNGNSGTGADFLAAIKGEKGDTGATGSTGAKGDKGDTGATGAAGLGLPQGGTTGQILYKVSETDYDTYWSNPYVEVQPPSDEYFDVTVATADVTYTTDYSLNQGWTLNRTDVRTTTGHSMCFKGKTLTASVPGWTAIAKIRIRSFGNTNARIGFCIRELSSAKHVTFGYYLKAGATSLNVLHYTADDMHGETSAKNVTIRDLADASLKVNYDGTNINYYYSFDYGLTWILIHTELVTVPFTVAPDQVGLSLETCPQTNVFGQALNCYYWTLQEVEA